MPEKRKLLKGNFLSHMMAFAHNCKPDKAKNPPLFISIGSPAPCPFARMQPPPTVAPIGIGESPHIKLYP